MKYVLEQGNSKKLPQLEIHWETILMCQYKCSYCYARCRNDWLQLPKKGVFLKVLNALSKSHLPTHLGLLGGEPTLHPNYMDILYHWNELCGVNNQNKVKNTLYTSTNGFKDINWFKKLPSYANMSFLWSFHPRYADNNDLENKIKLMLDKGYSCAINLMMVPSKEYRKKIENMYSRCNRLQIKIDPTFIHINDEKSEEGRVIFPYSNEFWKWFKDNFKSEYKNKYYIKLFENNLHKEHFLTEDEIFENNYNNFKGYSCMLNHYKINVDGTINLLCDENNKFNLLEDSDYFKRINKIKSFKCPLPACTCTELLEIPKKII